MTARPIFHHLEIPSGEAASATFLFEMQPILQVSDGRVMAYELLYRGTRPIEWAKVDNAVINFFIHAAARLTRCVRQLIE